MISISFAILKIPSLFTVEKNRMDQKEVQANIAIRPVHYIPKKYQLLGAPQSKPLIFENKPVAKVPHIPPNK